MCSSVTRGPATSVSLKRHRKDGAYVTRVPSIDIDVLPANILNHEGIPGGAPRPAVPRGLLSHQEKETIVRALQEAGGGIRATAKALGISGAACTSKMHRFGLSPDECR